MRPMAYAQAGRRLLMPFVPEPGHRDHGRSWMARGASAIKKLLYISDIDSYDVFVYNYETGESVGKLTGFNYPQGQCVDKEGDVWITNFGNGSQPVSVVEYAHGGTTPIATVIPDGYPIGLLGRSQNGGPCGG